MQPRERIGQLSIASAAPAGHSAPMPIPSKVRNTSRNMKVGENPAMKLQIEYQKMRILRGPFPPPRAGDPAGGARSDEPHPQCQGEDDGDLGRRDAELIRN